MMETIRTWLMGVTCAGLLIAVADALIPKGTVRGVSRLVGGLILFLAMASPVLSLEDADLAGWIGALRADAAVAAAALDETNGEMMEAIIAEETAAYIEEKAAELGGSCEALVVCRQGDNGLTVPVAVTVMGPLTEEQRQALSACIAADLAIPAEEQNFQSTEGE